MTTRGQAGYTLGELVMVAAIMSILAGVALPAVKFTARRTKEMELRHDLRTMRDAIDTYKRYSDNGLIQINIVAQGYPEDLDVLVEGVELVGQIDRKLKLLRRIPVDPMTGEAEWGLRSFEDEPDSDSWGGENVYDVYSLSGGVGLNGVPYREW
ncbi:MAG TPA: type II secretion system protein [Thermoanaerobaculia bacterium]|nr:type II secretion system protein [Thermoanaerobaculia bacterium]